ncbi:cytochrome P450-dit2 [Curvularia kusanoi]|uniref:Cytochrome P450-dit2 n=1 Tax=Curvularia kusanoi TaxID=90978 RepID=A0A9P4TPH0_CURKU|nr:cytochrome P450-dit2 [Curvularia kusanoi]
MVSYLSLIFIAAFATIFGVASFFVYLFTPPSNFPKNIPTIPFYYSLLPLFRDVDQAELYRQYMKEPMEKYGAVKLFTAGRWSILVRKPAYVAEVFKYEDTYAKAGNQVKLPHSLLAKYTGENIISSHGETWKRFHGIIKPALQADQDSTKLWKNSRLLKNMFLSNSKQANGAGIPIYVPCHRFALANLSDVLYESSFETMERPDAPLNALQMGIKPIIFNPIFMNFPFLDLLPFKSRQLGRALVKNFRSTLSNSVTRGHNHVCDPLSQKNVACRLIGARNEGRLSEKEFDDNIVATFLAGHENPQLVLISLMYLLGAHPEIQEAVRKEIQTLYPSNAPADFEPSYNEIHGLPFLTSVLYESIRMFPPISQLINRRTEQPIVLGGKIPIPKGVFLGYNVYSTNRDVEFWGVDSDEFKPARWGKDMDTINHLYRKANSKGAFISFHGGRRACLGQKFAMQELRITVIELVKGCKWVVDESWDGRMTPG